MFDNLTLPLWELTFYIPLGLLILRVNRGGWPKWMEKIALKWKLVVPVSALDSRRFCRLLDMEWIITALAIAVIFFFAKDGSSKRK